MKKLLTLSAISLALIGCSSAPEIPMDERARAATDYQTAVTNSQLALIPDWYLDPPKTTYMKGIYVTSTAESSNLQFAMNQATLLAEQQLSRRMDAVIESYELSEVNENSGNLITSSEQTIQVYIDRASLFGHEIDKREVFADPHTGNYRVYILMYLPAKAQIELLNKKITLETNTLEVERLQQYVAELELNLQAEDA
ncbi:hypothetical protein LRP52_46270 [Photobacterium sp. ZSDE20]|uniref:LPP20 lipoprotein n=1 Tax=Photobacterium pectinilyticum TaxID=2906793 RepID=A0ABT1N8X0_9GAMM|nr:hypothetical protein [Photobacterium sp. ZSDE20]MCQ1061195.1 hypothetical protein [Photobacterium sp. ZSDE20]MDD1829562.1 hypothetical protein [Photobacterium sp. ZSDE20]